MTYQVVANREKVFTSAEELNMVGVSALTQGDAEAEKILVDNVNKYGKALGQAVTRKELQRNQFDMDALEEYIQFVQEATPVYGTNPVRMLFGFKKSLLERILRDEVHVDMVTEFRLEVNRLIKQFGVDGCVNKITHFLQEEAPRAEALYRSYREKEGAIHEKLNF